MVECVYVKDELKRQTKKFCGFKQSQYAYQKIWTNHMCMELYTTLRLWMMIWKITCLTAVEALNLNI